MLELRGLVLTGGRSRRMGMDKAALDYHGVPQWKHLGALLGEHCSQVFWSCTEGQRLKWGLGRAGLVDQIPGLGPAGGLATAFAKEPLSSWLVVACDYPYLGAEDLRLLVARRDLSADATVFKSSEDGLPEPLLGIWEPVAQRKLLHAVSRGQTSPRRVLETCEFVLVEAASPHSLQNINRPIDTAT